MSERVKVAGLGGVFFRAKDPKALAAWYREHLGIPVDEGQTYATLAVDHGGPDAGGAPVEMVWSVMPEDTKYFGPNPAGWMVNYRVKDLDGLVAQLRAAGGWVSEKVEDTDFGRFAWAADPEGTRFELWQPPANGTPVEPTA
jgi:predicted enzyme related to lactoylglutathione lyase